MKHLLLVLCLAAPVPALAADNHAGVSLMGGAGFLRINAGSFDFFYEHVFGGANGFRLGADFVHVHHANGKRQSHQWTYGGSVAFRRYLSGGVFAGLLAGYRRGHGHFGHSDDPRHTMLESSQLRVLPQFGARLMPFESLSVVTALGLGYGPYTVKPTNRDDQVGRDAARYSEDGLAPNWLVLELEASIAYSF
jgi:hypothetical protein